MRAKKAAFLLVLADLEPNLDQLNAAIDNVLLNLGTKLQKPPVLLRRAETHDVLNTGAVVPARSKMTISPAAGNCCI